MEFLKAHGWKLLLVVVFLSVVVWQLDQNYQKNRILNTKAQIEQSVKSTESVLVRQIQVLQKNLTAALALDSVVEHKKIDWPWELYPDFYAVVVFNNNKKDNLVLQSFKAGSTAAGWDPAILDSQFKNLQKPTGTETLWLQTWKDPKNRLHLQWSLQQGPWQIYLFSELDLLNSYLLESSPGDLQTVLLNTDGLALAHPNADYLGQLFKNHSDYSFVFSSTQWQGYQNFVFYKRVPSSNILIISKATSVGLYKDRWGFLGPMILFSIGAAAIFLALLTMASTPKGIAKNKIVSSVQPATLPNAVSEVQSIKIPNLLIDPVPTQVLTPKRLLNEEIAEIKKDLLNEAKSQKKSFVDLNMDAILDDTPPLSEEQSSSRSLDAVVESKKEKVQKSIELVNLMQNHLQGSPNSSLPDYKPIIRKPGQGLH